jgi:hypothetical protein
MLHFAGSAANSGLSVAKISIYSIQRAVPVSSVWNIAGRKPERGLCLHVRDWRLLFWQDNSGYKLHAGVHSYQTAVDSLVHHHAHRACLHHNGHLLVLIH